MSSTHQVNVVNGGTAGTLQTKRITFGMILTSLLNIATAPVSVNDEGESLTIVKAKPSSTETFLTLKIHRLYGKWKAIVKTGNERGKEVSCGARKDAYLS